MNKKIVLLIFSILLTTGCISNITQELVENGLVVSADFIAQLLVDSTNQILKDQNNIKQPINKIEKNQQTANDSLRTLVDLSEKQGTGEITIFFPRG